MFREWLDEGFRKAGTSGAGFDIMPMVVVNVSDDLTVARAPIKNRLALYVGGMGARGKNFYNDVARRYGYEEAARTIQDLYLAGKKAEAEAAVPDAMADEVALVGPKERIREQLAEWKRAGVTSIMVSGNTEAVRTMAELVL
jgi:alkanesulfonate monooxygenase SsuD/methylene tetrahydromethanopterin reductase-like flavin-dependent oxidoreductase (luciferase family)